MLLGFAALTTNLPWIIDLTAIGTSMRYRRADVGGGTYFFTVNLTERNRTLLVDYVDVLRESVRWM